MRISFSKGKDGFYLNVFPSPLVRRFSREATKFSRVLKHIARPLPTILGILPLKVVLRLLGFSDEFTNKMMTSCIALFLVTGNQVPNVPSALLERLLDDKNMSSAE